MELQDVIDIGRLPRPWPILGDRSPERCSRRFQQVFDRPTCSQRCLLKEAFVIKTGKEAGFNQVGTLEIVEKTRIQIFPRAIDPELREINGKGPLGLNRGESRRPPNAGWPVRCPLRSSSANAFSKFSLYRLAWAARLLDGPHSEG